MGNKCPICGDESGLLKAVILKRLDGKEMCSQCAKKYVEDKIKEIQMTTTNNFDGYKAKKYIDIASVEIVIGTGIFSEFSGEIADFFGARSTEFEKKLQRAKKLAFEKLKFIAFEKGGNAVAGIDVDYTEFSGNRIGLIVNGTVLEIEKI